MLSDQRRRGVFSFCMFVAGSVKWSPKSQKSQLKTSWLCAAAWVSQQLTSRFPACSGIFRSFLADPEASGRNHNPENSKNWSKHACMHIYIYTHMRIHLKSLHYLVPASLPDWGAGLCHSLPEPKLRAESSTL